MQVVRGADYCQITSDEGVHDVLRQYRAQQGSKPPLEGPCVEGGKSHTPWVLISAMVLCEDRTHESQLLYHPEPS